MISKEDLLKIKEETLKSVIMREHHSGSRITVEVGDEGLDNGAREILKTIVKVLASMQIYDVVVTQSNRIHDIKMQVCVLVEDKKRNKYLYHSVTKELAERIVLEHIVNNKIIVSHILKEE